MAFSSRAIVAIVLCAAVPSLASEPYPTKSIRLIVPYAAGGPSDVAARFIAEPLAEQLGQRVVVDNRGGAGGLLATEAYVRDPADPHAILLGAIGPLSIIPSGKTVSYDPEKAFIPLGSIWNSAQVLAIGPKLNVTTLDEFIVYAKANPGRVTVGSAGVGSVSHLAIELLRQQAKVDLLHVPFRSTGATIPNVIGGQIDALFGDVSVLAPYVSGGSMRGLAIASSKRHAAQPDLPTMAELGVSGVEAENWYGLVVSASTPKPIVDRLQSALHAAQTSPAYKESLERHRASAGELGPDHLARQIRSELAKWGAIIKSAGIKLE